MCLCLCADSLACVRPCTCTCGCVKGKLLCVMCKNRTCGCACVCVCATSRYVDAHALARASCPQRCLDLIHPAVVTRMKVKDGLGVWDVFVGVCSILLKLTGLRFFGNDFILARKIDLQKGKTFSSSSCENHHKTEDTDITRPEKSTTNSLWTSFGSLGCLSVFLLLIVKSAKHFGTSGPVRVPRSDGAIFESRSLASLSRGFTRKGRIFEIFLAKKKT